VAQNLFKLMAYKDEYEVARLLTDPAFERELAEQFEAVPGQRLRVSYNLAPPAWAAMFGGALTKRRFGPWLRPGLKLLARLRFLRGTHFDPFGRTRERRTERSLAREYRASINVLLRGLNAGNLPQAIEIARIPDGIRGYGPVKDRNLQAVCEKWALLMKDWAERELVAMSS